MTRKASSSPPLPAPAPSGPMWRSSTRQMIGSMVVYGAGTMLCAFLAGRFYDDPTLRTWYLALACGGVALAVLTVWLAPVGSVLPMKGARSLSLMAVAVVWGAFVGQSALYAPSGSDWVMVFVYLPAGFLGLWLGLRLRHAWQHQRSPTRGIA